MARSTLLHGPQGAGKSLIAKQLARFLGLHLIVELDCDPRRSWPAQGVLLVAKCPHCAAGFTGDLIHVDEARRRLDLPTHYQLTGN